jgi:glycosyltransferase involved in cell wall biosynthesis
VKDELYTKDKVVIGLRNVLSVLPKLGLVKKPSFHRDGVSFIVPVKDEEQWIKPCIESIIDVADEIIVVDSSTEDSTTQIVDALKKQHSKIKHIRFYWQGANAFALSCHIGLVCASYKWVFKWDSDYVAKSPTALLEWKGRLSKLDKNKYYVIDVPRINLEVDLQSQPKNCPFGIYEARIFTWSPELRWALKDKSWEQITGDSIWGHRFPPWYKILRWHEPYIFHCNIKTPKRMLMRLFWDFQVNRDPRFSSLEEYTRFKVKEEWHMSFEEGMKKAMDIYKQGTIPYDKAKYGELPEVLQKMQKQSQA